MVCRLYSRLRKSSAWSNSLCVWSIKNKINGASLKKRFHFFCICGKIKGWVGVITSRQDKLAAPRKAFYLVPFFQYNKRHLLRQKMGGACLYMPQEGHWLASFEVILAPKKLVFPRPKKWKFPTENCFPDPFFFLKILAFYCLCGENFVTPFSTLAMIQGSLPTNSTTPDRLRSWTKTESEDFPGFWVRTLSKKSFFKRPTIY